MTNDKFRRHFAFANGMRRNQQGGDATVRRTGHNF